MKIQLNVFFLLYNRLKNVSLSNFLRKKIFVISASYEAENMP